MTKDTDLWLLRHAHREDQADPDWIHGADRPFDPGLTEAGHRVVRAVAERLRREGAIRHVFSSPFLRTLETATPIAMALGLLVKVEPGLGEALELRLFPAPPAILPPEAALRRFPIDADYRSLGRLTWPETPDEAFDRAAAVARALAVRFGPGVLLVTHAAPITGIVRRLTGDPDREPDTALCGLHRLVAVADGWRQVLDGDTTHCEETDR